MAIVGIESLAKWTQNDVADLIDDPFAIDLVDKVSKMVNSMAGQNWDEDTAPIEIWIVTLGIVKRCFENPGRVIQETTGPLGERVIEAQALFLDLTDAERETILGHNPDYAADDDGASSALFTIRTTRDEPVDNRVLFVSDDGQVALAESADPRPWMVPYLAPRDIPLSIYQGLPK